MAIEIGDAVLKVGIDTAGLDKGLKGLSDKMNNVGKNLSLKVTAPLAALGAASWKLAGDFDQSFRAVNVMLKASGGEVDKYKSQILGISDATGKSAKEVTDSFYQIVSAGYRGADAIDILNTSMKGAVGGMADATTTTAALTKAMNIFQLEGVEGSERAMDVFFGIVDQGLLTFEEMASAFPRAASSAAGLGVSIEETGAALATLSKVSGSTEQSATALNAVMSSLIKPQGDMIQLFEKWGVTTGPQAIEKFGGLAGVLQEVQKETGGEVTALSKIFPSLEAIRGVLPLVTTNSQDYADALIAVSDSAGRTDAAFKEMAQGPAFTMTSLVNKMKNSMMALGDTLANTLGPVLMRIVDGIRTASKIFEAFPGPIRSAIVVLGLLVAAVGPVLLITAQLMKAYIGIKAVIPSVISAVTKLSGVMNLGSIATKAMAVGTKLFGGALKTALGPIGIILTVLGILAVLMMKNEKVMEALRNAFRKIMDALQPVMDAFTLLMDQISDALQPAFEAFAEIISMLATIFANIIGALAPLLAMFIEFSTIGIRILLPIITKIIEILSAVLIPVFEQVSKAFKKVGDFFKEIWEKIKGYFFTGAKAVLDTADKFLGWIPFLGDKIKDAKKAIDNMINPSKLKADTDKAGDALDEMGDSMGELGESAEDLQASLEATYDTMKGEAQAQSDERIQALYDEYGISEDMLEDHVETKMELLDRAHEAYLDQLDKELDAEERLHDERMDMFDEEYEGRFKLLDLETQKKLLALQGQIDDLDAQTEEEERIIKAAEEKKRYEELVSAVQNAKTNEERARAAERLNDFIADVERKRLLAQRQNQIDVIKAQMENVEDLALLERQRLEQELKDLQTTEVNRHNIAVTGINDRIKLAEADLIAKRNLLKIELQDKINTETGKLNATIERINAELAAEKVKIEAINAMNKAASGGGATPAAGGGGGGGWGGGTIIPTPGADGCVFLGKRYANGANHPTQANTRCKDGVWTAIAAPTTGACTYMLQSYPNGAQHPAFANQVCRNGRWAVVPYSIPNPNQTPTGGTIHGTEQQPMTPPSGNIIQFAKGGMVTEPTAMLGLESGQRGIMAEVESEVLLPAKTFANIVGAVSASLAEAMDIANDAMRRAELDEGGLSYTQRGLAPISAAAQPVTAMEQAGDTFTFNMPGMVIREEADIPKLAREMKVLIDREKRMVGR